MERVNQICRHPLWRETMRRLAELEQDRPFCRHSIEHLLDVARLAYVEDLEQNFGIPKAQIYAAALLHDTGRVQQYLDGTPHERAALEPARKILSDCAFTETEQNNILTAISGHRLPESARENNLTGLLYRADKRSRLCMFCPAEPECNWSPQKKNMILTI